MRVMSLCGFVLAFALAGQASAQELTARISPERPYAEPVRQGQALNFDMLVSNGGAVAAELTAIEIILEDAEGRALLTREADGNGSAPARDAIPNRSVPPGEERMLLNPFPVAAAELPVARVRARLSFAIEGQEGPLEIEATAAVHGGEPIALALPLRGELHVWSAHDLMAHHRRFDYALAPLRAFGMVSNAGRYAYDLVMLDAQGRRAVGDESVETNWVGFGAPVTAPVDGVVVATRADMADNGEWNPETLPNNPNVLYGNHIIIEHNGAYVVLAHLKQGSVQVQPGQRVRSGQVIAAVGHSGSSLFPHLHVQVMDGSDSHSEGVPSVFTNFERRAGERTVRVREGSVETGDYIRAR